MYTAAVSRSFNAFHFPAVEKPAEEKVRRRHHYEVTVRLEGCRLDERGYLVDIARAGRQLDGVIEQYSDRTLNELPEFRSFNSGIEHFARIMCREFAEVFRAPNVRAITVILSESDGACASYRLITGAGREREEAGAGRRCRDVLLQQVREEGV